MFTSHAAMNLTDVEKATMMTFKHNHNYNVIILLLERNHVH